MNPATLTLIMQGISAAITLAPKVPGVINSAKELINGLFTAQLITVEQQNALHAWVDAQAGVAAAGVPPYGWTVDPN